MRLRLVCVVAACVVVALLALSWVSVASASPGRVVSYATEDPGSGCGDSCWIEWYEWGADGLYYCQAGWYMGNWYFRGCVPA